MPDTVDDLIAQWRIHGSWPHVRSEDFGTLVDEIERLRKDNHAFALRIQDAWKRIETLEQRKILDAGPQERCEYNVTTGTYCGRTAEAWWAESDAPGARRRMLCWTDGQGHESWGWHMDGLIPRTAP